MASPPKLTGLTPEAPEEEAPAVRRPTRQGKVSAFIRPRHEPMNCYPTSETKTEFENRVHELAEEFRKANGRKIPNGMIHELALSMVLENWDEIASQVME